jgi:PadR family transcriptional regulator, regulatory protein PadR
MGEPQMTLQTLAVVRAMLDEPTEEWYGLELARRADLKSGTIYPLLARLERFGWLHSRWEEVDPEEAGRPRRRLYMLTAEGERAATAAVARSLARISPEARWRPGAGWSPA